MLMGGEEADLLWNATVDAFVAGQLGGDTPVRSGDVRAGTAGLVANDAAPGPPWPCRLPARRAPIGQHRSHSATARRTAQPRRSESGPFPSSPGRRTSP